MKFRSALHFATFLTVASSFWAAAVGRNLHPVFVVIWIIGLGFAGLTPEGKYKGSWVLAVGIVSAPALVAMIVSAGLDPVLAAVYFASLLLLVRFLTRKGAEEHGQVHLLSILVLAGGAAISPDLSYMLIFIGYLFAITFALLLTYFRRESGEAVLDLPVKEVVGKGLFAGTILLGIFAVFFTGITFVIFPRATIGIGMGRPSASVQAGLSDHIELAGFGQIKENDRMVLRVRPLSGTDSLPESLDIYWRTQTLEHYNNFGWRAGERRIHNRTRNRLHFRPRDNGLESYKLEVEVVTNLDNPVLPVPDRARNVVMDSKDGRGNNIGMRIAEAREIRTTGTATPPYKFTVEIDPAREIVDLSPPLQSHLMLPEQTPETIALSEKLFEEANSDRSLFPSHIVSWMEREFSYSDFLPEDTSLDYFLFERKAAHCEYFATAMAVLLRLQGVPARVVLGFHGARWNPSGDYYSVRHGNAHAWVEAWHDGSGWKRYEPTPPRGRGRGIDPPSVRERLADFWDSMQARWVRNVLEYDQRRQMTLARNIGRLIDDVGRTFMQSSGDRSRIIDTGKWFLGALVLIAVAILLLRTGKFSMQRDELSNDQKLARKVYRSFISALKNRGLSLSRSSTSEDILNIVLLSLPSESTESADIRRRSEILIRRYGESRFGNYAMSREEAASLQLDAKKIADSVMPGMGSV